MPPHRRRRHTSSQRSRQHRSQWRTLQRLTLQLRKASSSRRRRRRLLDPSTSHILGSNDSLCELPRMRSEAGRHKTLRTCCMVPKCMIFILTCWCWNTDDARCIGNKCCLDNFACS